MWKATKDGHLNIVELFIGKGAVGWNSAMYKTIENNHFQLVKFDSVSSIATGRGYSNLVKFLSERELFI